MVSLNPVLVGLVTLLPELMRSKNLSNSISTIKKPKYFIDQAAPRFELGIKDLQSPALPLGHAAKSDPKSSKILFIHIILLISIRRRGLLNPFWFFLDRRIPFYPFPIPFKKFIPVFYWTQFYSLRLIVSQNTHCLNTFSFYWKEKGFPVTDCQI